MSRKDSRSRKADRKKQTPDAGAAGGGRRRPERLPPPQDVTWQGAAASIADLVGRPADELPPGVDMRFVLWLEEDTEIAVGATFVDPSDLPGAAVEVLIEGMRNPMMGPPRRPAAVVVRDPALAAVARARLEDAGVEVRVAEELPLWDRVVRLFLDDLAAARPDFSYLEPEGVTPELMSEFFRAAADYYQSAPWRVVQDDTFELHLPGRPEPVYATVMGSGGMEYGLALHFSLAAVLEMLSGEREPETFPDALAVTFDPESELPDTMREERRRHRWKVAGPSAFPVPMRTRPPAEYRDPDGDEITLLTLALDTMREFIGKHAAKLSRLEPVTDTVRAGEAGRVQVIFPAPLTPVGAMRSVAVEAKLRELEEEYDIDPTEEGEGGRTPLMAEMHERILSLPAASALVRRLAWTFFRDRAPYYLEEEDELAREEAAARFSDWAFYLMPIPPHDLTWAEMALQAAGDLSREERAERERFIHPVYGIWEVVKVDEGEGMTLRGVHDGKRYRVRERMATYQIRRGWTLFGPLFPISESEWVLGTMTPFSDSIREEPGWKELRDLPPVELAPLVESSLHGAGVEWIEELERRRDVKEVWDGFRDDLGGWLYGYAYLERKIREADSPVELLQAITERGEWWTENELEVAAALLMRAWNVTTRPDLGGRSPEQMRDDPRAAGPEERRIVALMGPPLIEAVMQAAPRSAAQLQKTIEKFARRWLTSPHPELEGRTPEQLIEQERRERGTLDDWEGIDAIIENLRVMGMPI